MIVLLVDVVDYIKHAVLSLLWLYGTAHLVAVKSLPTCRIISIKQIFS